MPAIDPGSLDPESRRLEEDARREKNWKRWGPYLSERQWGTVREDYSGNGDAWNYFPFEHSALRAYRWGEDGLLGFTDRECRLCFALALWNTKDPILKERLFGLSGPQGNHGEDVKEAYFYLASTPTHSYCSALYKYPQARFPYEWLREENRRRTRFQREFELADTGVFDQGRYFDVLAEYAKDSPDDLWIRVTIANRGPEAARVHVLPTLWFRNTWVWGCKHEGCWRKPYIKQVAPGEVTTDHLTLGQFHFSAGPGPEGRLPELLFTENESNLPRLFGVREGAGQFFKDGFHDYLIHGRVEAVNPRKLGTKVAPHYDLTIPAGGEVVLRFRLHPEGETGRSFPGDCDQVFAERIREAELFEARHTPERLSPEECQVVRQARAGLLWSKQFYHLVVQDWLEGDSEQPPPPRERKFGRNIDWGNLYSRDVISMPDKWEYPWFAAWDLAFHVVPLAQIDPHFAKSQLVLFLREWYMHPNGQIPAYEWNFSDVNPPVHAWACWRVYQLSGGNDRLFLARVFHKLLLNFTWWVNRKDVEGNHLFSGGFLGLDNIGVFDRSRPLPGIQLEQADATAWMAFYCGTLLVMAMELARENPAYEDVASKFLEHFIAIADAMNSLGGSGLWDEEDGFWYDQMHLDGRTERLRVRSLVGLIPLIAVEVLEENLIRRLTGFNRRLSWFVEHRRELARYLAYDQTHEGGQGQHRLLAIPTLDRLRRVLGYLLDENEFLSPYGIRSLSRHHQKNPFVLWVDGWEHRVDYTPGESTTDMFGGNSNWRGPVWLPVNCLLIEALFKYHHFYGDELKVECPTGSGKMMNLEAVANELIRRLVKLFLPGPDGQRPAHGSDPRLASDPHWKDLVLFHEYFHGDTGEGLGASHQTGWTALVASLLTGQEIEAALMAYLHPPH